MNVSKPRLYFKMVNFYLFVSSDDYNSDTFTYNKPDDFTVDLLDLYTLESEHEIAIVDLYVKKNPLTPKDLYVFCDLCADSYVASQKHPIIKWVDLRKKFPSSNHMYFPVKRGYFNKLRIYIKDKTLSHSSFPIVTSFRCVLHIRERK